MRRNRYRGAELHNIRKLLPFPTRQLVNWDFRDTKYGRNKADAEAHLRFQVSSIIRGFKLMYSSKRPHLSLERLTHNNLYCFIRLITLTVRFCHYICLQETKRPRSTLHLSLLCHTANSKKAWDSVKYFSLENGSKDEKV